MRTRSLNTLLASALVMGLTTSSVLMLPDTAQAQSRPGTQAPVFGISRTTHSFVQSRDPFETDDIDLNLRDNKSIWQVNVTANALPHGMRLVREGDGDWELVVPRATPFPMTSIVLTATDEDRNATQITLNVEVRARHQNQPAPAQPAPVQPAPAPAPAQPGQSSGPVIIAEDRVVVPAYRESSFLIHVQDPNGDAIARVRSNYIEDIEIDREGPNVWEVEIDDDVPPGDYTLILQATDSTGQVGPEKRIVIAVGGQPNQPVAPSQNPGNQAPVSNHAPVVNNTAITVRRRKTTRHRLEISDPDGNALKVRFTQKPPSWVRLNKNSLVMKPGRKVKGSFRVHFEVSDGMAVTPGFVDITVQK